MAKEEQLSLATGRLQLWLALPAARLLALTRFETAGSDPGETGRRAWSCTGWEFMARTTAPGSSSPLPPAAGGAGGPLWELRVRHRPASPESGDRESKNVSGNDEPGSLTIRSDGLETVVLQVTRAAESVRVVQGIKLPGEPTPAIVVSWSLSIAPGPGAAESGRNVAGPGSKEAESEEAEKVEEVQATIEVRNESRGFEVTEVAFPLLAGVRAHPLPAGPGSIAPGEPAIREALVYPFFAGLRFDDPVHALTEPFPGPPGLGVVTARPVPATEGLWRLEQTYCGQLSMAWLDYFVQGPLSGATVTTPAPGAGGAATSTLGGSLNAAARAAGLYLACHDPSGGLAALRVDVDRRWEPATLTLGIVHPVHLGPGQSWSSPPAVFALHPGDWHWGARRYRAFARKRHRILSGAANPLAGEAGSSPLPSRRPAWLEHSDSLIAHYDFKWQDGTFTHTFRDLYPLYERAKSEGLGHLFIAGWSSGGFDHLYPEYYPDLSLGTVMDFIDGVRRIRRSGGQVTFYINAALFGTDSHYHPTLGAAWSVRSENGEPVRLHFFQKDFTVNCRGADGYRRQMVDTVVWLAGEAGASGVYLDCYAAIGPYPCFASDHGHVHPFTWNADARALLARLDRELSHRRLDPFLMIEGCGDLYAPYLSAGLVHGWYYAYSYPEMYRYTFPEFLAVDMVYPAHGQRFRPAGISTLAYDQLHRTLLLGHLFWFYDQEDARFCNFRTDPEMWTYIRKLLAMRAMVRPFLQQGEFLDDEGLEVVAVAPPSAPPAKPAQKKPQLWRPYQGQEVVVKRFRLARPAQPDLPAPPGPAARPDEGAAPLPVCTGELLAVWRRGPDELPPPGSPAEVEQASAAAGQLMLRVRPLPDRDAARPAGGQLREAHPREVRPRAWLVQPGSTEFTPWPVEVEAEVEMQEERQERGGTGNHNSPPTLLLPLPACPAAMILLSL